MNHFAPLCVRGEEYSNPWIRRPRNPFNDMRLYRTWRFLDERLAFEQNITVQQLAKNHKEAAQIYRFLGNPRVSHGELIKMNCSVKPEVLAGRHVLIIGDNTSFNLSKREGRIKDSEAFGVLNDGKTLGFHSHINLVVGAEKEALLGVADILHWARHKAGKGKTEEPGKRAWQEKESYRWAMGASNANKVVQAAGQRTFLFDSEADNFALFEHLIFKESAGFIIRAHQNRKVKCQGKELAINGLLPDLPAAGTYKLDVPALNHYSWTSGKRVRRQARQATMEVRFQAVELLGPQDNPKAGPIPLYLVEAKEITEQLPEGEEPILWRLWTTHPVENAQQARLIIHYYTLRWIIEQLFRTLKKKGFNIEATQLGSSDAILHQTTMAIKAACTVLQLTYEIGRAHV